MALEVPVREILCFGTFEVDARAGELRRQGKRIKLQEQPFQVLAILLRRPGDMVTREELRSQIWSEDTFVDFDRLFPSFLVDLLLARDCGQEAAF